MKSVPTSPCPSGKSAIAGVGLMLASIAVFSDQRCARQMAAGDLFGRASCCSSAAPRHCSCWHRSSGRRAWPPFTRAPRRGLQIVRVLLSTLEVAMFFWAVSYLPLADTVTFYLAGPIYVTALSVILLREKVRLAPLDGGDRRLRRRRAGVAAVGGELHAGRR